MAQTYALPANRGECRSGPFGSRLRQATRVFRAWIAIVRTYYEIRVGLGLRVLVLNESGDLFLCFVGNHDQVRAFIKQAN